MKGTYVKIKISVLILFILPILVNCEIAINVTVHSSISKINITYVGNNKSVATQKELKLFNVTYKNLNKGIEKELGKSPDDIYLRDPTPNGETFKLHEWEEVKRRIKVKSARVMDVLNKNVVLDTHEHINLTPNNITSTRSMYRVIENTVSSTWLKDGVPGGNIFYNISIDFKVGRFNYVNKWRNESMRTVNMLIGETKNGSITIQPGQTVVTRLSATKTIMLIEVTYEARLVGNIVASYATVYGKYHFWAPTIENIMKAAKIKNEVITKEILEVKCYTNPILDVYDKLTGEVVEPPRMKRPLMKIIRKKNMTRIIYVKTKPSKQKKHSLKINER